MNELATRAYCVVPSGLLKALLFIGIGALLVVGAARFANIFIPMEWIVGLIAFFFAGAILVSHRLSILRKPGLVLLLGVALIVTAVQLQEFILAIFA